MKVVLVLAVAFAATILPAPAGAAEAQAPPSPEETHVYTNADLARYEEEDALLALAEPVDRHAHLDPMEWTMVEEFLKRWFERIDTDRRQTLERILAETEEKTEPGAGGGVPYWVRYPYLHDPPRRRHVEKPRPPGKERPHGRDAVPKRPVRPRPKPQPAPEPAPPARILLPRS